MKIYLAARYGRIDEMNRYAAELRQRGHSVTSRWLDGDHQLADAAEAVGAIAESMPLRSSSQLEACRFAAEDYYDVRTAQLLIAFTEQPGSPHSRGGRHVELGLALAWRLKVVVIGPRENIFHCLSQVDCYPDWETFKARHWLMMMQGKVHAP